MQAKQLLYFFTLSLVLNQFHFVFIVSVMAQGLASVHLVLINFVTNYNFLYWI
jgi:hypothetical protein